MIVELGHVSLVLAFALAVVQSVVPLWGTMTGDRRLMATADTSSLGILLFVAISFGALMWSYAVSDFSVANVWQNSHSQMPFLYKLTGTWGNHEGSMLLWLLHPKTAVKGGVMEEECKEILQTFFNLKRQKKR